MARIVIGNGGVLALGVISSVIAARALGPEARGAYFSVQGSSAVIGVLASFGLPQTLVILRDRRLPRGAIIVPVVLAAAAGGVFALLVRAFSDVSLGPLGILGGAFLISAWLIAAFGAAMAQRLDLMSREFQRVRVVPQVVLTAAMLVLWVGGVTSADVWLLVTGALLAVTSGALLLGLMRLDAGRTSRATRARGLAAVAVPALLMSAGSQMLYRGDVVLVAFLVDAREVGLYSVAVAVATAVAALGQASGMRAFPQAASLRGNPSAATALLTRGLKLAVVISSGAALAAIAVLPWAISLLYGEDFQPALWPAAVLALSAIPQAVDYLITHMGLALGAWRSVVAIQLTGVVFLVCMGALGAAWAGIMGVAVSCVAAYTISALLQWLFLKRFLRTGVPKEAQRR